MVASAGRRRGTGCTRPARRAGTRARASAPSPTSARLRPLGDLGPRPAGSPLWRDEYAHQHGAAGQRARVVEQLRRLHDRVQPAAAGRVGDRRAAEVWDSLIGAVERRPARTSGRRRSTGRSRCRASRARQPTTATTVRPRCPAAPRRRRRRSCRAAGRRRRAHRRAPASTAPEVGAVERRYRPSAGRGVDGPVAVEGEAPDQVVLELGRRRRAGTSRRRRRSAGRRCRRRSPSSCWPRRCRPRGRRWPGRRERADRQRRRVVEQRGPRAAAVRRLPDAAVRRAGVDRAAVDRERGHATADQARRRRPSSTRPGRGSRGRRCRRAWS